MLLGTRNKPSQFTEKIKLSLDNTDIHQLNAFKFLVTIDQNLTWKNQIDNLTILNVLVSSGSKGILYKIRNYFPKKHC